MAMSIEQKIAERGGARESALEELLLDKSVTSDRETTEAPSLRNPFRAASRKRAGLLAIPIVLSLAAVFFLSQNKTDSLADAEIVTALRGDVEQTVTALGNLQPRDYVDVGAQVSGQLKRINVEFRRHREGGRSLGRDRRGRAERARRGRRAPRSTSLQAQLADRQAQSSLAQAQLKRQAELKKANATSEDAYDTAEAAARSAAAQINSIAGADRTDASRRCTPTRPSSATPRSMRRWPAPSSRSRPSRARR